MEVLMGDQIVCVRGREVMIILDLYHLLVMDISIAHRIALIILILGVQPMDVHQWKGIDVCWVDVTTTVI